MTFKSRIITFTIFTVFMFLIGQFIIAPKKPYTDNLEVAVIAGVIYMVLSMLFARIGRKKQ